MKMLAEDNILGFIPYDEALNACEIEGKSRLDASPQITAAIKTILEQFTLSNLKIRYEDRRVTHG